MATKIIGFLGSYSRLPAIEAEVGSCLCLHCRICCCKPTLREKAREVGIRDLAYRVLGFRVLVVRLLTFQGHQVEAGFGRNLGVKIMSSTQDFVVYG